MWGGGGGAGATASGGGPNPRLVLLANFARGGGYIPTGERCWRGRTLLFQGSMALTEALSIRKYPAYREYQRTEQPG